MPAFQWPSATTIALFLTLAMLVGIILLAAAVY